MPITSLESINQFLSPVPATAFRIAKSFEQSRDCFLKSCDCHKQNKSWFHAAKALEQVILVCKEMNNLMEVHQYAERACNLYQQHGSPEAGASALDKAAKMLEATHPEKALSLYQHALDVVMVSSFFGIFEITKNLNKSPPPSLFTRLKTRPVKGPST